MSGSGSKAPLVLMEQVVMGLVFALAATLCVQAFVKSRTISVEVSERDYAVRCSQTVAETAKAYGGDLQMMKKCLGGTLDGANLLLCYGEDWEQTDGPDGAVYVLRFKPKEADGLCRGAEITVLADDGEREISSIPVAWQEDGHE